MSSKVVSLSNNVVLDIRNLRTEFPSAEGVVVAVNDVSLSVGPGEIVGIVGESGSGKSALAYSILGLIDAPGRIAAGSIKFRGQELAGLSEAELSGVRGNRMAIIFQDPMTSLHPLLRIERQMIDAITAHRKVSRADARSEAIAALAKVGIAAPEQRLRAYPHQLSGGTRQRVAIAIAMINKPDLIIADEPTTALDVTTQAQIIREMKSLCAASGTALVWITHDLAVVSEMADAVAIMYAGSIVEMGTVHEVLDNPAHPYTAGLLASVPARNRGAKRLSQIPGSVQSAAGVSGCAFAPRCSRSTVDCNAIPALIPAADGRKLRCFNPLPAIADARLGAAQ
jgi:peptide/nickel transport system ATP-binding protein